MASAPKRALPIPNKPVSIEEADKAARINNWTVGLAGGLLEGTFSKYAADLGKALDDGDNLRVLPIISYGAVGNVTDLIYLKGVDFAITYADVLDYFKNVEKIPGIDKRVNYVIPMFLGPVHIYVRPEIKTFQDLVGKKVGFNTVGSAANYTGGIVFDRLGIKVERVFQNNALALEAMRRGELAGIVHVVGKPNELFAKFKPEPGFHFLPVEFGAQVRGLLHTVRADVERLSQSHPGGAVGRDHRRAGTCWPSTTGGRIRTAIAAACASSSICSIASRSSRDRPSSRIGRK